MTGIRFLGMASGLPPNIVEQIMEGERIPVKQMENKKMVEDDKLKLITDLDTKIQAIPKTLGELMGTRGFQANKLLSGDPTIINGTVDPDNVLTGTWAVEVERLAHKPGALTSGFEDKDKTQMGTGYIRFFTTEGKKEVYINSSNNTLEGIANAINNSGNGLKANILNDRSQKDAPFKLLVTGLATGDDNQVEFPVVYMLDGDSDFSFDQTREAQNAKVKIDGFAIEVPENTISDIIPGVNLELKQSAPGKEVMISVKEDSEVISGKIKEFVDAYNAVLSFIQGQNKLQKDKAGRERLGPLGGDGLTRSLENTMRRLIINPQYGTNSSISRIIELGIEFSRGGTLNFSLEKFQAKLVADPKGVAGFLRGDGFQTGFVPTLKRELANLVNANFGPIGIRKKGLSDKIKNIDQRIETKEKQLEKKEESLRRKFSDLESKMSKLQSQGAAVGGMAGGMAGPAKA